MSAQKEMQGGLVKNDKPINNHADRNQIKKTLRILAYLKKYTDEKHTTSQVDLLEGVKQKCEVTYPRQRASVLIGEIIKEMNPSEDPEHRELKMVYGEEDIIGYEENGRGRSNLHYKHAFSWKELDKIIDAIMSSDSLSEDEAKELAVKVAGLNSVHYKKRWVSENGKFLKGKARIRNTIVSNMDYSNSTLDENIKLIQKAIEWEGYGRYITFYFNGYNSNMVLEPIMKNGKPKIYKVAPHRIVNYNGKYYMVCASSGMHHRPGHYRIDYMSNITILEDQGLPVGEREGLSNDMDMRRYMSEHLNMYFDEPESMNVLISKGKRNFIHDWFGDKVKVSDFKMPGADYITVKVNTSPNAMVDWALQYSDMVEIQGNLEVRKNIQRKIRELCYKYHVEMTDKEKKKLEQDRKDRSNK